MQPELNRKAVDDAVERLLAQRRTQGLPPRVVDAGTLRVVAALVGGGDHAT